MSIREVIGDEHHGVVDNRSAPVKIGGVVTIGAPAAVDNADRVNAHFDEYGRQYVATLGAFGTNNVDAASATVTYVGKENPGGAWLVMKIDTSSGTAITYASVINNALVTTYAAAWAARATTLSYGTYSEAI